jgi:hypothetical protein
LVAGFSRETHLQVAVRNLDQQNQRGQGVARSAPFGHGWPRRKAFSGQWLSPLGAVATPGHERPKAATATPTNRFDFGDDGRLRWPLGLRLLAASQAADLREQIDALYQVAARQATTGPVNPDLAPEMGQAVVDFRRLVLKDEEERFGLPLALY